MTTQKVRKAVLPVAGLGTRFLPATKAMPKEMLTVVDKPIIQYAVEEALAAGIEEFIFVTGRGKDALENHFDYPYELADTLSKKGKLKELEAVKNILPKNARVVYTRQGEPLGLGHAIWSAKSMIGDEPFAVLLPDVIVYSDQKHALEDMVNTYEDKQSSIVMVEEVADDQVHKYGILDPNGDTLENGRVRAHGFVEKPKLEEAPSNLALVGRYVFTPRLLDFLQESVDDYHQNGTAGAGGEVQLTDAMDKLLAEEKFYGCTLNGYSFDCGDKFGFQQANLFYALKNEAISDKLQGYIKELVDEKVIDIK